MQRKRIAITGIGVQSPIGSTKELYWQNLFAGRSHFAPITLFNTDFLTLNIAGEITDFDPSLITGRKTSLTIDRGAMLLMATAKDALADAGITVNESNTHTMGVVGATTFGSLHNISEFDRESLTEGPRYANPSTFTGTVVNSPASKVAIQFKIKGFNTTLSTGICSALDAMDYACDFIHSGRVTTVLVGAVEDLSQQIYLGFYKLGYLSGQGKKLATPLSCPFDRRRDGILCSEGSSSLLVQEWDTATSANAKIYGEVLGIGSSFDPAKLYRYNPHGDGMAQAMHLALRDAELRTTDIDCVFANANATRDGDLVETRAIKKVFGKHASALPVTAIKSMLGETFSASGGMAIIAALGALDRDMIPPTMNYQERDPACDLDYVPGAARPHKLRRVMVNAFSPNGGNISIIVGKHAND